MFARSVYWGNFYLSLPPKPSSLFSLSFFSAGTLLNFSFILVRQWKGNRNDKMATKFILPSSRFNGIWLKEGGSGVWAAVVAVLPAILHSHSHSLAPIDHCFSNFTRPILILDNLSLPLACSRIREPHLQVTLLTCSVAKKKKYSDAILRLCTSLTPELRVALLFAFNHHC